MTNESTTWWRLLQSIAQSQGYLTYANINEHLPLSMVDPEEIDRAVEQLKRSGITIVESAEHLRE